MAEKKEILSEQENMKLQISADKNEAWMTIFEEREIVDENDLIDFLNTSGIRFGFENAKKENKAKNVIKKRNVPFLIAKGSVITPKPKFDLFFDPENAKLVTKNSVLAKIHKSTEQPIVGKNIFGEEVKQSDYQFNPEKYCGNNCLINEDNEIIAKTAGIPILGEDKTISIQSEMILDSVIDKQLTVETDLIVNGEVNGAKLMVNGNLTIYGNVVNCMDGIYVNGDVKFLNGDHSKIIASGKISFEKCRFCSLLAEKEIIGINDSSIIGGFTISGDKVQVRVLGNDYKENTDVEIAIAPYLKEQIRLLSDQLNSISSESNREEMKLLYNEKIRMEKKYLQKLIGSLEKKDNHSIKIEETIYPGVFLRIMDSSLEIKKITNGYFFEV